MERTTLDMWVGAFVVGGLVALLILAFKVGNLGGYDGTETYEVYGEFDNIGGLKPRAPVKSAGVVVGRVADISFDNQRYEATVTMQIDRRYKFPKDTSAAILTSGLLGEQYIGFDAGSDATPLKDGETVKLTQSAVVLETLISHFLYDKADSCRRVWR